MSFFKLLFGKAKKLVLILTITLSIIEADISDISALLK